MKIHPALNHLLEESSRATDNARVALREWQKAGCPVVEEPSPQSARELDMLLEQAAAKLNPLVDAKLAEKDRIIAGANAMIKELEGVIASQKDSFYGRIRIETAEHIRNAALEKAAKAVHEWDSAADITGGWWRTGIAEKIRGLKK